VTQILYPPYHFSTSPSPLVRGVSFNPILCQPDKAQGRFTFQGAVYFGGAISLQGSLGAICPLAGPGIYEVTLPFLATGRVDVFALGISSVLQGIRLPLSSARAEVFLRGIVEDTNGNIAGSATLPLVQSSGGSAPLAPHTLSFSSSSYSLSIPNCLFQSSGLVYIHVEIRVRLRAGGAAFSRVDFASGGANHVAVPFIRVDPKP
jgi:hypothetical protein